MDARKEMFSAPEIQKRHMGLILCLGGKRVLNKTVRQFVRLEGMKPTVRICEVHFRCCKQRELLL
jgi:hypothetical protein